MYLDIFSCVKMNVFRSFFFAFRLEMHVRCDNQYKPGADRENILGQPMLFVRMGTCAYERESTYVCVCVFTQSQKAVENRENGGNWL